MHTVSICEPGRGGVLPVPGGQGGGDSAQTEGHSDPLRIFPLKAQSQARSRVAGESIWFGYSILPTGYFRANEEIGRDGEGISAME